MGVDSEISPKLVRTLGPLEHGLLESTLVSENVGPLGGVLVDPTSVGEGNETFFIRVWKPLPNRHVLNLEGKPERKSRKMTISTDTRFSGYIPVDQNMVHNIFKGFVGR